MRLWHQSTTDLNLLPKYRGNIINHAKQVLDPGITVEPHGFPAGTRPEDVTEDIMQYPYVRFLCERLVCEAALTAERDGFDAMTIGCNLDIGLRAARSFVNIPVVSVTESSMHTACMLGRKFAFVTISNFLRSHLTVTVEENGLQDRLACVVTLENPYAGRSNEAETHGQRPIYRFVTEEKDEAERLFLLACERAIALGADVLIPGEGILNEFIFERGLSQCNGVPILDANATLWHCGIMMSNLRSKSKITTSRGYVYKRPGDDLLKRIRDFHQELPFTNIKFS